MNIYNGKRVFVTGHTGFKGSWLCCLLQEFGAEVAGFALEAGYKPSHYDLINLNIESTIGNILDKEHLKESIKSFQPEVLFHLAAQPLVRESYRDPLNTYNTNVMGTLNVLESIRECPSVKTAIIITTDKVYENQEWTYSYRENDILGGYDIYSSSKACCELLIKSYTRSFFNISDYKRGHKTLIATVRAGNVIGGGDWSPDRLIPDIVKSTAQNKITKIRNPSAIRPWQHVLDCLYGYLLLGEKLIQEREEFTGAWNFAPHSYEAKTVREIADISKSIWQSIQIEFEEPKEKLHEAMFLKLDNSKAITNLGWQPRWDTDLAVAKTIEWYKSYYMEDRIITKDQLKDFFLTNGIH